MHRLLKGIDGLDRHGAGCALSSFGDASDVTEQHLVEALDLLPGLVDRHADKFETSDRGRIIVWYGYENLIWDLGESFRRVLKRNRALRGRDTIFEAIERVCLDARYGKGRESFTMLLGQYGGPRRVPVLLRLLDDPEVCGHALYALRLLGRSGAESRARTLLSSPSVWIRGEAKKYLEKVAKERPRLVVT